jgi:hypothetical protein
VLSLIGLKKFPVPLSRELLCKLLISIMFSSQTDANQDENNEVPCILPCYQGTAKQRRVRSRLLLQRRVNELSVPLDEGAANFAN